MPLAPTMARATFHHSSRPHPASPLASLGLCRTKGRQLGCSQQYITATLPAQCCAHCHWPRAHLGSPQPQGLLGCSFMASGVAMQLPCPLSSCRNRGVASQTICCTDFVLLSLPDAPWSLPGRGLGIGQEFVLDTDSPSVRGMGKKSIFRNSCGCIIL